MVLYIKITLLKADGETKIVLAVIQVIDIYKFTNEIAEKVISNLMKDTAKKENAVSVSSEWVSPMEAAQIIQNFKSEQ